MVSQGRFHAHPASLLALPPPPLPPAVALSQLTFRFVWNPESDLEMEEEGYALLLSQLPESWAPGDSGLASSVSDLSQMLSSRQKAFPARHLAPAEATAGSPRADSL